MKVDLVGVKYPLRARLLPVGAYRMKRNTTARGTFYLVLAIATFAVVAGFALGSFTFGSFGFIPKQTGASGVAPGAPAGVQFPLAEAELVTPSSTPATGACTTTNLGTNVTPNHLTDGGSLGICLNAFAGGYLTGDTIWILEVSWNATASVSTLFNVSIFESTTPTADSILASAWIETSATITASETAVFAVDLSQGTITSVNSFNVLVTQV